MRKSVKLALLLCIATSVGFTAGCKKDETGEIATSKSGTTPWRKYDTPAGADKSVPANMGGEGFEAIADSMGFVTYMAAGDELKHFGDPNAKTGGEIKTNISRFPVTFRPFGYGQNSTYTENGMMSTLCYEGLLGLHPVNLEFVPALASHWKISDDKMTYTFRINPNARFADGKPVTAEDVLATYRLIMDETILSPSLQLVYGKLEEPKVLSKYLVEVKAKDKNWRNILYFGASLKILGAHEIGGMTGKEFLDKFLFNMPVGSGEYIILPENIKKQESYVYTRREDYWAKDEPLQKYIGNFDRIHFETIKDNPILQYEKYKKGESDYFYFTQLTTEQWKNDTTYDALQKGWTKKIRIYTNGPAGAAGYYFNMRKPPFDDIRVRKAFAYLHPRESIIEKILLNEYVPIHSYYGNTAYENPANPKVTFNPEMAAKLLAEAGWKTKNANGILMKDGKPFVLEISIVKPIEKFAVPYQQELRKVGIDFQIKFQDENTMTKNVAERNFNVSWRNYGGLTFPNPETSLKSDLADKNDNNNINGFKNARVDELLAIYDTTFEQSKRVEIIREIDKIEMETYKDALAWTPRGIRFAIWDKFGIPEYGFPRYAQAGDHDDYIAQYWWYDETKAKALEEARKNGKALGSYSGVQEYNYWKTSAK